MFNKELAQKMLDAVRENGGGGYMLTVAQEQLNAGYEPVIQVGTAVANSATTDDAAHALIVAIVKMALRS